jgi:hypothetical protein
MAKSKRSNRRKAQDLTQEQNVIEPDPESDENSEFEREPGGFASPGTDYGDGETGENDTRDAESEAEDEEDAEVDEEQSKLENAIWEGFKEEFHESAYASSSRCDLSGRYPV